MERSITLSDEQWALICIMIQQGITDDGDGCCDPVIEMKSDQDIAIMAAVDALRRQFL